MKRFLLVESDGNGESVEIDSGEFQEVQEAEEFWKNKTGEEEYQAGGFEDSPSWRYNNVFVREADKCRSCGDYLSLDETEEDCCCQAVWG